MQSLTIGAAQQTVLRLLQGQETCNGEMNNTQNLQGKPTWENQTWMEGQLTVV